jgi:hypothetical protein
MLQNNNGWKNWSDHPIVVLILVIAALISIFTFITDSPWVKKFFATPTSPVQVRSSPTPVIQQAISEPTVQLPESTSVPLTATPTPFLTTYEVYANLSWQDTGIQIKLGDRLRIIWDGKSEWRGVNYGNFSDPLGGYNDPNSKYDCPSLAPEEQVGWNALVAKIGVNGMPANPFKVVPAGEGNLYLAMNDCDKQRYDNEGSVIITIEVRHSQ